MSDTDYPLTEIRSVSFEARKVSPGRTALLVLGTGAVVVIWFAEVFAKGFAEGLGPDEQ